MRYKYPSTPHLPYSPGLQNDDRRIRSLDGFYGQQVVATEKRDGENTTWYRDGFHARSLDSQHHPSRDYVKAMWGRIAHLIPANFRVCGENMYAKHSIAYDDLPSFFEVFSVWDGETCLAWDQTEQFAKYLGLPTVPVIYAGPFDDKVVKELAKGLDFAKQEGLVVRVYGEVKLSEFDMKFAKYVRKGHVQTDEHWMTQAVVPNKLRT